MKKYLLLLFLLTTAFLAAMYFYPVDEELEKEKIPKVIRTIIYKPDFKREKLTASKNMAITKTKDAPKINQKSPVQKVSEVKPQPRVTRPKDASQERSNKNQGNPEKRDTQQVRKTKTASNQQKTSPTRNRPSKAPTRGGQRQATNPTKSTQGSSKSRGKVDVYRSQQFDSTINNLLAKGGKTTGLKASASGAESSAGTTDFATGGSDAGLLQRAEVSKDLGSLTGSTTGRIDTTKGAQGLVNKKRLYTAGIPAETVVLGSMDPDIIRRILRDHIPQFRFCYQKELDSSSREFSGQIGLIFSIGASGSVSKAGVSSRTSIPSSVKGCVLNVLRGIKFPEPLGGGTVDVRQPISFYPVVR